MSTFMEFSTLTVNYLAVILNPSNPDGIRANGGDGGAIVGAILALHVDGLTSAEPALLIEELAILYPGVACEGGRRRGARP